MRIREIGSVLLALVACSRGSRGASEDAGAAGTSVKPGLESVVRSLPLELGVGDSRELTVTVWPLEGPNLQLQAGTRVERLEERAGARRPTGVPERGAWRVRITDGDQRGIVAYVRNSEVQAAR